MYKKTARNVCKTTAHNMYDIKYALRLRYKTSYLILETEIIHVFSVIQISDIIALTLRLVLHKPLSLKCYMKEETHTRPLRNPVMQKSLMPLVQASVLC